MYPRIIALAKLGLPSRLPFGTVTAARPLFMDPARPVGIREYRAGDTLRQIHWKATAHSGALSVKTFEPAISLDTAILLDLHRGDYDRSGWLDRTEWAIEVAASAASHLIDHRQAVGLATNGVDPLRGDDDAARGYDPDSGRLVTSEALGRGHMPGRLLPRPGRSQLMSVLEILARVESSHTLEFAQWTPGACLGFGWGITLLAVVAARRRDGLPRIASPAQARLQSHLDRDRTGALRPDSAAGSQSRIPRLSGNPALGPGPNFSWLAFGTG